jgi:hypothetical protein
LDILTFIVSFGYGFHLVIGLFDCNDDDDTEVDDDDVEEDDFGQSLPAAIAAAAADTRGAMLESGSKLDALLASVIAGSDDLSLFTVL